MKHIWRIFSVLLVSVSSNVYGQETSETAHDYSQLSIEQLTNLEVTSPSRKPEKLANVASAIFVLTSEDIRRSGATSMPDALRLVPGLTVAQIDKSEWAITSRGFNGVYGDKLLVLMDGRSIYTPFFGGVYWNEHDTILEDIDRIEVIRGPGATLYGANAVNGVINIITKKGNETHGVLASASGGKEETGSASLRYGEKAGDTDFRVYTKFSDRDDSVLETGMKAHDNWQDTRGGFRTDTKFGEKDLVTLQGDGFYGESGWDLIRPTINAPYTDHSDEVRYYRGGNMLSRWSHKTSEESDFQLQAYYDFVDRDDEVSVYSRETADLYFQNRNKLTSANEILWGGEYRHYQDHVRDESFSVSYEPDSRSLDITTAFIQDEITLIPDSLRFIAGVKLEHNDFSGVEVLPNVRLVSTPDEKNTIWGAVSRAVRSPARFNNDGKLVLAVAPGENNIPNVVTLNGDHSYDSEELIAYEVGYRVQPARTLSFDFALFYNDYSKLESAEPAGNPFLNEYNSNPFVEIPLDVENKLKGTTYGGEAVVDWRPYEEWRLVGTYSHINIDLERTKGSVDTIFSGGEGQSPEDQFMIRSVLNLPYNFEFDNALRYVSDVPTFQVNSYYALDSRIGWHATNNWEIALIGRNLLDNRHLEFASNLVDTERTQMERAYFLKATYRLD